MINDNKKNDTFYEDLLGIAIVILAIVLIHFTGLFGIALIILALAGWTLLNIFTSKDNTSGTLGVFVSLPLIVIGLILLAFSDFPTFEPIKEENHIIKNTKNTPHIMTIKDKE